MSELNIKVVKPSFTVLPDHMDPIEKVARMARICYRSEAASTPETDAKLISGCISRGHTSVIEHGYISVFFDDEKIDPKEIGDPNLRGPVSSLMMWNQFDTPDRRKYIETFGDDQIFKKIDGANAPAKVYPVYIGNYRAWLNILDDCLEAALLRNYTLGFAFTCGMLTAMHKAFPVIFQPLIDKLNNALTQCSKDHPMRKCFMDDPNSDAPMTIANTEKYYKNFRVIVTTACPRFSFSAILRTDRAVSHEIVRHRRDVNYSQESQRYVNYGGKGIEVMHPALDPVKHAKYRYRTVDGMEVPLDEGGFLPENTKYYTRWCKSVKNAVEDYLYFLDDTTGDAIVLGEEGNGNTTASMLPENARVVLQNCVATTLGVTWTPATFVNLMRWRLEKHAYWPFRDLIGKVVIEGLRTNHEFFENFAPRAILHWLQEIEESGTCTDVDLLKDLRDAQEKRQTNIDLQRLEIEKKIKEQREKMLAEQKAKEAAAAAPAKSEPACVIAPTAEKKD